MTHRETTITVYGTTRVIRTEQTGTVRQLETTHTNAVKAALEALHTAGKPAALTAAKQAAKKAAARSRDHLSGPELDATREALDKVKRIEKRRFTPATRTTLPRLPFPAVKFDLDPTDARFADYYEPNTAPAPEAAPEPTPEPEAEDAGRRPTDADEFLAWILAPYATA